MVPKMVTNLLGNNKILSQDNNNKVGRNRRFQNVSYLIEWQEGGIVMHIEERIV